MFLSSVEIEAESTGQVNGVSVAVGRIYRARPKGFSMRVRLVDLILEGRRRIAPVHAGSTLDFNGEHWLVLWVEKPLFGRGSIALSRMGRAV